MTGCVLASVQIRIDVTSNSTIINCTNLNASYNASDFEANFPQPTAEGYFKAFSSIMFAFGGASTFPTIQADMNDKSKFKMAAALSMALLFLIYFPTAAVGYISLGTCVNENVIMSMSDGGLKTAAECVVLLHLISALPIVINPPSQYFEELLKIPKEFSWKRCVFRTVTIAFLLFIAVSVPSFGSILDLIGGSTITLLTFIMPPMLYMIVMDHSEIRYSVYSPRELSNIMIDFFYQAIGYARKSLLLVSDFCRLDRWCVGNLHCNQEYSGWCSSCTALLCQVELDLYLPALASTFERLKLCGEAAVALLC